MDQSLRSVTASASHLACTFICAVYLDPKVQIAHWSFLGPVLQNVISGLSHQVSE